MIEKITLRVSESEHGQRLDRFVAQRLASQLSQGQVRKLIVAGAVYLNRARVRIASKSVFGGAVVELHVDWQKLAQSRETSRDRAFEMTEAAILYEDADLIAFNKPAGLPTQPTVDEARQNLFASAKAYLKRRDGHDYLGLHHRLDRDTSGVLLMTKTQRVNQAIGDIFKHHQIKKIYQAICSKPQGREGQQPSLAAKRWSVENYLAKTARGKQGVVRSGGDRAKTEFLLRYDLGRYLWVQAEPETGRMHQIRVHLAGLGMPILGDRTYGGEPHPGDSSGRMLLHAERLELSHPVTSQHLVIVAPLPADFDAFTRGV